MTTLILVHGAWHGAWAWNRLHPHLIDAGYRVITPTLPGADGEAKVGLRQQANDLYAMFVARPEPVVLVGHSYAGLVVREAAARAPHMVKHLLLLDAWLGADGQSMFDLIPPGFRDWCLATATGTGDERRIPPPAPRQFGVTDPEDADWLRHRLRPQPWATFNEPTRLDARIADIAGTAVLCEPPSFPFADLAEAAGYPTRTISAGHDVMLTAPTELAQLMVAILSHHDGGPHRPCTDRAMGSR